MLFSLVPMSPAFSLLLSATRILQNLVWSFVHHPSLPQTISVPTSRLPPPLQCGDQTQSLVLSALSLSCTPPHLEVFS
jgi:hypothetical protein